MVMGTPAESKRMAFLGGPPHVGAVDTTWPCSSGCVCVFSCVHTQKYGQKFFLLFFLQCWGLTTGPGVCWVSTVLLSYRSENILKEITVGCGGTHLPVMPAPWRLRQKDHKFEASLGNPCLKIKNKTGPGTLFSHSVPVPKFSPPATKGQTGNGSVAPPGLACWIRAFSLCSLSSQCFK